MQIQITIRQYFYADYSHEFSGRALAQFQRSSLPEHEGTRTIVLRFLKMITPVKCVVPLYDGYLSCPKEGELYMRTNRYTLKPEAWSVNIDKKEKQKLEPCFQLLWDASPPLQSYPIL